MKLDSRERRWLFRSILHELFHDRRTCFLMMIGASLSILGVILLAVDEQVIPVPVELSLMGIGIGAVLIAISMHSWAKLIRVELIQHLLRLERCGCCAQRRTFGVAGNSNAHRSPARDGWTCSECGATWWAGQADRSGLVYRDAA